MISSPFVRVISCLLLAGCGGARSPSTRTVAGSPDAPSWTRGGDEKSDEGSLFVCEGAGPDEQQAYDAARAMCSAKICELCGVEVKSTVETRETLQSVDVERKVVETCRRVRKGDEEVRYRQVGCGPGGCTAWLQVFFGAEAEARECRAYADGNFADSSQCEDLIERFRSTPDRTAESFRVRADLLTRAIVACAEIDVRPTPKLTALDEILWQGVVTPRAERRSKRPIDEAQPISERLRLLAANRSDAWKTSFAESAYQGIDRQPLLEGKVLVDRIAIIRDAMLGYASIMTALEALADAEEMPDAAHDAALVRSLRALKPVAGKWTTEKVLYWVADELSRGRAVVQQPAIKAFLMEKYQTPSDSIGDALMAAMVADAKASDEEWRFVIDRMTGCIPCAAQLLNLPDPGEAKRIARLVELSRRVRSEPQIKALQDVHPELLLHAEASLDPALAASLFSYAWLRRWLEALPTFDRDRPHTVRKPWTSRSYDWVWKVSPAQHDALAMRAWQLFQVQAGSLRCDDLDRELRLLDTHGVDTRTLESRLCGCVSEPRSDGMRGYTELYERLVAWDASCVAKEGR